MNIFVVGSINMDLVVQSPTMPKPGETLIGNCFFTNPGGKGANQAVAISRSNCQVEMVGCVGEQFGEELKNTLEKYKVGTSFVKMISSHSSGVAFIILAANDNRIIVSPGSNHQLTPQMIDDAFSNAKPNEFVVLQLEIPVHIVNYTIQKAKEKKLQVILNPAPACDLPEESLKQIDYLILNQSETKFYTGIYPTNSTEAISAAKKLRMIGVKHIIITLGEKGSIYLHEEVIIQNAIPTTVVDTTAAGDTFIGAFVSQLAKNKSVKTAIKYASIAASICISRIGAQQAIPTEDEILNFKRGEFIE